MANGRGQTRGGRALAGKHSDRCFALCPLPSNILSLRAGNGAGLACRALRLAGAAAAQRTSMGIASPQSAQVLLRQRLAPAREALDEEAVALAWAEGAALSRDEAVAQPVAAAEILARLPAEDEEEIR